jgi:hypothetical protein
LRVGVAPALRRVFPAAARFPAVSGRAGAETDFAAGLETSLIVLFVIQVGYIRPHWQRHQCDGIFLPAGIFDLAEPRHRVLDGGVALASRDSQP